MKNWNPCKSLGKLCRVFIIRQAVQHLAPGFDGIRKLPAGSDEGAGVEGLGVLEVTASRYPDSVVVPQLGWNSIEVDTDCRLLQNGAAYFANSYRLTEQPRGWRVAWSDHGGPFVADVERGNVLGCQFHPELSGSWGEKLIERWSQCERGVGC